MTIKNNIDSEETTNLKLLNVIMFLFKLLLNYVCKTYKTFNISTYESIILLPTSFEKTESFILIESMSIIHYARYV